MDFTREPIIETVITPKEGCKIVVRSSKSAGQEEYFVDALEVVSFGNALFYRSLEKPKAFLVPATDYEILEVREARMVLKNVGLDRSIKIGGGREPKQAKEAAPEKAESAEIEEVAVAEEGVVQADTRADKKRDRRRQQRRRRGNREETVTPKEEPIRTSSETPQTDVEVQSGAEPVSVGSKSTEGQPAVSTPTFMSSLLPPPPTLISETIGRYKENVLFKNAFYSKEEAEKQQEQESDTTEDLLSPDEPLPITEMQPMFATFWDDMNQPSMPPLPPIEKLEEETEKLPPSEESKSSEKHE